MNIFCIGHAAYDTTVPVDEYPLENTKNRVVTRIENGGGPANNACYLLGKWGMKPYFVGIVGDDKQGRHIKHELESVDVNTKYLELNKDHTTTSSFIIANKTSGSRTILTYRPSDMKMKDVNIDERVDMILLDGQEYELSKKILKEHPDAISIIDAGRAVDEVIELSKMVDFVACSKDFLEQVTDIKVDYKNHSSLIKAFLKLEEILDNNVIVTLESHGCMYRYKGEIKLMPSIKVKSIDSTGAGDIFHGAFTYALANDYDFEDAIRVGNIAGAISVTRLGSKNSMPEKQEMESYFHEFR